MKSLVLFFAFAIFPAIVLSHGILFCPPARSGQNVAPGIKMYPEPAPTAFLDDRSCNSSVGSIQATYVAGSTIDVTWDTTVAHTSAPGVRIAISYSSSDSFNSNVLLVGGDVGGVGYHTAQVQLDGTKTAQNAVLQWTWNSASDGGFYIGCSDITIVAAGGTQQLPTCPSTSTTSSVNGNTSSSLKVSILIVALALILVSLF